MGVLVRYSDARRAGICLRMSAWFRKHNLDWDAFVKQGVDVQTLYDTKDHADMVRLVEVKALERINADV